MFWNYLKIALRNLRKNKLHSIINIAGLAIGLAVFLYGMLLIRYETTHDSFFKNSDRIYTIGNRYKADGYLAEDVEYNETYPAVTPLLKAQIPDIEAIARTWHIDPLIEMGDKRYFDEMTYVDKAFLEIFDFDYLYGDKSALDDPSSMVITRTTAMKFFGRIDVIDELVNVGDRFEFRISAIIEDLPLNSHFKSIPEAKLDILVSIEALVRDLDSQFQWVADGDLTYVLLPEHLDKSWLEAQLQYVYETHIPDDANPFLFSGFVANPLSYSNLTRWEYFGIPFTSVTPLLSALILIIACVNYANLSIAQSFRRSREVGMRKTMGASRRQLLCQFLLESTLFAFIAMLVAVALLELAVSATNQLSTRELSIDYQKFAHLLLFIPVFVGLIAGAYPAWLITKSLPIDALKQAVSKGKTGIRLRFLMIGAQFSMSIFILGLVAVVQAQNNKVEHDSYVFPRSEIYTLNVLIREEEIISKIELLRDELEKLPEIQQAAISSQLPYMELNNIFSVSMRPDDPSTEFKGNQIFISPEFLETYDIPLLAGRNLIDSRAGDYIERDHWGVPLSESVNVLVNELVLEKMGIASAQEAIGQRLFDLGDNGEIKYFVIVGVVPTRNINGLSNQVVPWMFLLQHFPENMSLRVNSANMVQTIADVKKVWEKMIPGYPMRGQFLDEVFDHNYRVYQITSQVLTLFALLSFLLASIGLFGLASYIAAQRTKEIGIRKILGASSIQITKLLIWQISKPIIWALIIGLPAAFFASNKYLAIFPERINSQFWLLLLSGVMAVALGWLTVAGRAYSVARANPVDALRHE